MLDMADVALQLEWAAINQGILVRATLQHAEVEISQSAGNPRIQDAVAANHAVE